MDALRQENPSRMVGMKECIARTATPPAFTLEEQQDRFDEFRLCFNRERPHEALAF